MLAHLVLTELRPFYIIMFSANVMLQSGLIPITSTLITTSSFESTDTYSVPVLASAQCVEKIATELLWQGTSQKFVCTIDRLDAVELGKGNVVCYKNSKDQCDSDTGTWNGEKNKWRDTLASKVMLTIGTSFEAVCGPYLAETPGRAPVFFVTAHLV